MCRNIRTLHNFEPPASAEEVSSAALAVRAQGERHAEAVARERRGLRARGRRGHAGDHEAAREPRHVGSAEGPRGRGGAAARARGRAVRPRGLAAARRSGAAVPPTNADLERGRELYAHEAWAGAFESLERADRAAPLRGPGPRVARAIGVSARTRRRVLRCFSSALITLVSTTVSSLVPRIAPSGSA